MLQSQCRNLGVSVTITYEGWEVNPDERPCTVRSQRMYSINKAFTCVHFASHSMYDSRCTFALSRFYLLSVYQHVWSHDVHPYNTECIRTFFSELFRGFHCIYWKGRDIAGKSSQFLVCKHSNERIWTVEVIYEWFFARRE